MTLPVLNCSYREAPFKCRKGYYGGFPSDGICKSFCPEYKLQNPNEVTEVDKQQQVPASHFKQSPVRQYRWYHKHRGLGDTVKWAIKVVSFGLIKQKKDCGCKNRQNWLNRKFPYPWSKSGKQGNKMDS